MTRNAKLGNSKTASIYARCSTDETRQDVENQLVPLRRYAEGMGHQVIVEYVEYARGGDSNRPEFQKMMKAVRQHKFDIVLVWSLDRFSREGIFQTLSYIKTMKDHNVALKCLQDGLIDTTDSATADLIIALLSWVAKRERDRISERTIAGLERAKRRGVKLGKKPKIINFEKVWREYETQGNVNRAAKILPYGYGTIYRVVKNNIHDQEAWEEFVRSGGCR